MNVPLPPKEELIVLEDVPCMKGKAQALRENLMRRKIQKRIRITGVIA